MKRLKKKIAKMAVVSLFSVSVLSLTACGDNSSNASEDNSSNATGENQNNSTDNTNKNNNTEEANVIYGEIKEINGNTITLALGTSNMPSGGPGGRGNASGGAIGDRQPNDMPLEDGNTSGGAIREKPNGTPPANDKVSGGAINDGGNPPSDKQGRGNFSMLTLTGEETTITVEDESLLTRGGMGGNDNQTVALSDLAVGNVLKITYTSEAKDTIQSIEVMGGQPNNQKVQEE